MQRSWYPFHRVAQGAAFLSVLILLATAGPAQQSVKRPLTHADCDSWRSIQTQSLSRDGKYLAYAVFPQEGDGEVIVRELPAGTEIREPAGAAPPPPERSEGALPGEEAPTARSVSMAFTSDSRFLVFTTFPSKADTDKAKKEKKKPEEMPKGGLVVVDLKAHKTERIADVKSFQVPAKGGAWIAYLKEAKPEKVPEKPAAEKKEPESKPDDNRTDSRQPPASSPLDQDQARGRRPASSSSSSSPASGARREEYGTDLVLRDAGKATDNERVFSEVTEYIFARDGKTLVFAVSSKKPETNGAYAIAPGGQAAPAELVSGKGRYTKITWDIRQTQLALLSSRDDADAKPPKYKLYHWNRKAESAAELVSAATPGFHAGWVISERGSLSFSRDGSRLFFACAPPAPADRDRENQTEAAPPDDKVVADLWHWKDPYVQPMQKVRATQDRARSYRAVYHLADKKLVQLADPTMAELTPTDNGRYAIGADDRAYRSMVDYDGRYTDYYIVDAMSGERKPVMKKVRAGYTGGGGGGSNMAPDGRHFLIFDDKNWLGVRIPEGTAANLTANRGVNFFNEESDTPGEPSSYGTAGWVSDGASVLLYDRYDVWRISADGQQAVNVTQGVGRRENIQFRVVRLEPKEEDEPRGINPARPLLLRAEHQRTRDSGFWRAALKPDTPPQKLLMGAKAYRPVSKARDADVVLITASTFNDYTDLLVTDSSFRAPRKVTDVNPQKAQMAWGTGELMEYQNADGVALQAALYKPENFDPRKKYPLLVYIYEKLSQGVNSFVTPRPGHSINIAYYVSNGYLVLTPDIVYTVGHPGQSAVKCVLPAIQAVADKGFLDEKAIGIQGHSWGGYQIAYLITQTTRFRAAAAGAPVGNMISAYNGIRWGSGLPRQFQYEKTQSRIGATLWQAPMLFVENSPIFHADRVQTPLLILHNDGDDAVPWYQGIELFLSLRRLGKEAYFFDYNGEPHGLRRRPNQKDYTVRLQQFFDHFLKGAPRPGWMESGIPYLDREQGFAPAKADR